MQLHRCICLLFMVTNVVDSEFKLQTLVQSNICHIPWDPSPCTCYEVYDSPHLVCKNLHSTEEMANIFQTLDKRLEFNEFRLMDSNVTVLTKGIFGKASFQGFQFHDNSLEIIERGAFQGSEATATGIVFMKNKITQLDFSFVQDLTKLQVFVMSHELITSIPDNAFEAAPFLATVELTYNPIATIGQRAFASLKHINSIVVKHCTVSVTRVGDEAFFNSYEEHLESLLFSYNNLSVHALSSNSFAGINTAFIDLQHNNLNHIDETIFTPLLQIMSTKSNGVILGFGNPLQCDNNMKWLMKRSEEYKKPLIGFQCQNGQSVTELKDANIL